MTQMVELAAAMKAGMRHLASGVAVFATLDKKGLRRGMTVTSITSISDQPPSLLVSLNLESQSYRALQHAQRFSVSILSADQQPISERCAFTSDDQSRFTLGAWLEDAKTGMPFLSDSLASFFCSVSKQFSYGTHSIVIGDITEVKVSEKPGAPLIYCRGAYYKL